MLNHINPNDYQSRLHNSIILYDGFPVLVGLIGKKFQVTPVHSDSPFKTKDVDPRDPKIDISTPPLGWFNYMYDGIHYAIYIEKAPVRRWRQGICSINTSMYYVSNNSKVRPWSVKDATHSQGFEDMILGKYPSIEDAMLSMKKDNCHSVAVSRNIAIGKRDSTLIVFYKRDEAGWIDQRTRVVHVPKEQFARLYSKFLRELNWRVE